MFRRFQKRKKLKEFTEMVAHHLCVVSDPMNGCPSDFKKGRDRVEWKERTDLLKLGASQQEIDKAYAKGIKEATVQMEIMYYNLTVSYIGAKIVGYE